MHTIYDAQFIELRELDDQCQTCKASPLSNQMELRAAVIDATPRTSLPP